MKGHRIATLASIFLALQLASACARRPLAHTPGAPTGGPAESLVFAMRTMRPSIVQIAVTADCPANSEGPCKGVKSVDEAFGTGFVINSQAYVLTARHVVEAVRKFMAALPADRGKMLARFEIPQNSSSPNVTIIGGLAPVEFDVVVLDEANDFAILKLRKNPFIGEVRAPAILNGKPAPMHYCAAALSPDLPEVGTQLGISGFPFGHDLLVSIPGWVASGITLRKTMLRIQLPPSMHLPDQFQPSTEDAILVSAPVNPGDSGAPAYTLRQPAVIGMSLGFIQARAQMQLDDGSFAEPNLYYNSGLADVVPASDIKLFLNSNGISFTEIIPGKILPQGVCGGGDVAF